MNVVFERDGGMSSHWPPSSPQRSTRLPLLTNRSLLLLQNKGPKDFSQGPKWVNSGIFGNKHENIGFFTPLFWTIFFVQLSTQLQTTNFVQTLVWVRKFQSKKDLTNSMPGQRRSFGISTSTSGTTKSFELTLLTARVTSIRFRAETQLHEGSTQKNW